MREREKEMYRRYEKNKTKTKTNGKIYKKNHLQLTSVWGLTRDVDIDADDLLDQTFGPSRFT